MSGTKHCAVPLICRLKAYTPLLLLSLIPSKVPPVAHQGSWIIYATICLCILLFMNLSKHVDDVLFDMWLSNFSFSHSWSTKLKHNGNSSYNYVISSIYIMPSFWMSWHVDHDELYFVWKKDIYLSLYTCCCCGGSSQLIYDSKPASANVNHSMTARNRMADLEKFFAGTLHSLTTFTSKCHLLLISCCHLLLLRTRLNSLTLSMLACLVMWYSI